MWPVRKQQLSNSPKGERQWRRIPSYCRSSRMNGQEPEVSERVARAKATHPGKTLEWPPEAPNLSGKRG
jgi:hypothetical protein